MTEPERACILVAENDVLIRNLISTILSNEGHLVLAAANTAEALELSRTFASDIRLLVAKNRELAETIAKERPGMRVVLLSPSISLELKKIVREVAPGAFRQQATFPLRLRESIQRALTDPNFGGALIEV